MPGRRTEMTNTIQKATEKAESHAEKRGYDLLFIWIAEDNSHGVPYTPDYWEGDILVEFKGRDLGSVSWIENWGQL